MNHLNSRSASVSPKSNSVLTNSAVRSKESREGGVAAAAQASAERLLKQHEALKKENAGLRALCDEWEKSRLGSVTAELHAARKDAATARAEAQLFQEEAAAAEKSQLLGTVKALSESAVAGLDAAWTILENTKPVSPPRSRGPPALAVPGVRSGSTLTRLDLSERRQGTSRSPQRLLSPEGKSPSLFRPARLGGSALAPLTAPAPAAAETEELRAAVVRLEAEVKLRSAQCRELERIAKLPTEKRSPTATHAVATNITAVEDPRAAGAVEQVALALEATEVDRTRRAEQVAECCDRA